MAVRALLLGEVPAQRGELVAREPGSKAPRDAAFDDAPRLVDFARIDFPLYGSQIVVSFESDAADLAT